MQLLNNKNAYKHQKKILIAVDCVIFGFDSEQLKLLLFKRKVEPLKGAWSLIGAFVNEDLSLSDAAKEIVFDLTGLDNIFLEELQTYSKVDRDPGERVISVAHYSLIRINDFDIDSVEKFDARWFNIDEVPELIIDHKEMVEDATLKIRKKARFEPIVFELLPEKFTIPQLQILYECIYQKKLDDRNFRKKILSFNILTKTEEKDRSGSKKGAFLYKFNKEKFEDYIAKGHNFEL
ncbi:NUDIX domain-containing protein [Lutibacter sp. A64]|uniref:NUDIX hydrolase n=1 Tax=Lutibacter sp. A64 TaxID=2918526 RepID=UPI001F057345|nr:NUDIX domain-containing protein [Lutibacter sp. A64]UMB54721.1 NUDIX domain-containing protein [Lutibacter sp. A64]